MNSADLKSLVDANPDVALKHDYQKRVDESLAYLESDAAQASLRRDAYWPKWNSPWWHMQVLHEMGLGKEIPGVAVDSMLTALNKLPAKFFPIDPEEVEPGWDLARDATCHCAAGSVYAILAGRGVDVDCELPWLRDWFPRYQMADGGLNCDPEAYRVEGECPSSMVGLIAPFEALLYHGGAWSDREIDFLDRGAQFLMDRQLSFGSETKHNAEEAQAAQEWKLLCFPRLYYYDVLRGLRALLIWSERRRKRAPLQRISVVLESLLATCPEGIATCRRLAYAGIGTRFPLQDGRWAQRDWASAYPLLDSISYLGQPSPFLTAHWTHCKQLLRRLVFEPVVLAPPDPKWPGMAGQEGDRLAALLGDNAVKVHHIGSTAIPGICAKPVLDLAPEVRSLEKLDAIQEILKSQGYEYWGEYGLKGRRFCPRVNPEGARVANIHCYVSGSPELHRHLAFRDFMRAFPERASEYEKEKLRARDLHPFDIFAYNEEKDAWIRRAECEALEWKVASP